MTYKKYRFVGFAADVWIPGDIEVIIDIVPSNVRNVRSNQPYTAQDHILYHETGNTRAGANAIAERNYLHSGAEGRYVGYNFAVDDRRIIQLIPLNEVTWHAGVYSWNQRSWGVEQCVGSNLDLNKARANTCALIGALCAAKGWTLANVKQHNVTYGKDCPQIIRREGLWGSVTAQIEVARLASAQAAKGGVPPTPAPTWEKPVVIDALDEAIKGDNPAPALIEASGAVWIYAPSRVEAIRPTKRYQYADRSSKSVGPDLTQGTRFDVSFITFYNGEWWYYTPWATRIAVKDTVRLGPAGA